LLSNIISGANKNRHRQQFYLYQSIPSITLPLISHRSGDTFFDIGAQAKFSKIKINLQTYFFKGKTNLVNEKFATFAFSR